MFKPTRYHGSFQLREGRLHENMKFDLLDLILP